MSAQGRLRAGTPVRQLPSVLRAALTDRPGTTLRLELGEVVAIPDELRVTISIGGEDVTMPRLAAYTPNVGEPAYVLAGGFWTIAIGTVAVRGGISEAWITARGDLIVGTGAGAAVRKAVGGNDTVLAADSGQSEGVAWKKIGDAMVASGSRLHILSASGGNPGSNTYLRGDGTWATPTLP